MKKRKITASRVARFLAAAEGKKHVLIVLQDNPDPDAIASAAGLKALLSRVLEVKASIAHGGTVGRAENKALVEFLNARLVDFNEVNLEAHDLIVLVDTQPGTGNNFLPENVKTDVVIDHHPLRPSTRRVRLHDVRPRYGATATIVTEYLYDQDVRPDRRLATALVYGIKTDTAGLSRQGILPDREAMDYLYPLHAPDVVARFENEKVPREYFAVLKRAMTKATLFDDVLVTNLGTIDNPDMVAEVADMLLRLEEVKAILVLGIHERDMLASIRLSAPEEDAEKIIRQVVEPEGAGGGHTTMAGGRIRLNGMTRSAVKELAAECAARFVSAFGKGVKDEEKML